MNWLKHTLINLLLILLVSIFTNLAYFRIFIILLAGILIDADHLINDIAKHRIKGKSLIGIVKYWWQAGNIDLKEFYFLHNIEFIAFLSAFAMAYSDMLLLVSLGFIFHITGDMIFAISNNKSLRGLRSFSLFCFLKGNY